jgi:hypothetical protein
VFSPDNQLRIEKILSHLDLFQKILYRVTAEALYAMRVSSLQTKQQLQQVDEPPRSRPA